MYSAGIPVSAVLELARCVCCEGLGGEVVVLDGTPFECTPDAPPRPMDPGELLPFVDVCAMGDTAETVVRDADFAALESTSRRGWPVATSSTRCVWTA